MKKSTLFISSLVLSSVMVFAQSSRKAAPLKHSHSMNEKTISIDEQAAAEMHQNANSLCKRKDKSG